MPWVIVVKLLPTVDTPWTTTQAVGPYPDGVDIRAAIQELVSKVDAEPTDIVSIYPLRLESAITQDKRNTVGFDSKRNSINV